MITLKRAGERQEKISQRLKGLDFDFFYGIDKNSLTEDDLAQKKIYDDIRARRLNRHGKGMIKGHIACSLSHRLLYQHIIEKGYKKVMIFEDDAVPLHHNLQQMPQAISELPADWEFMYFGFCKNFPVTQKLKRKKLFYLGLSYAGLMKMKPSMVRNLLPKPYSDKLMVAGDHDLLHAYAVTASACKKLVKAQTPVVFNADPLVSHLIMKNELKAYIPHPEFFTQERMLDDSHPSYIHQA